jgi:hypothetical protein
MFRIGKPHQVSFAGNWIENSQRFSRSTLRTFFDAIPSYNQDHHRSFDGLSVLGLA